MYLHNYYQEINWSVKTIVQISSLSESFSYLKRFSSIERVNFQLCKFLVVSMHTRYPISYSM